MVFPKKRKIILCVTVLLVLIAKQCYAKEGFLLIKDDVFLYKTKECNTISSKRTLYKFSYGEVKKEDGDAIYIRIANFLFKKMQLHGHRHYASQGAYGWIKKEDVILFDYKSYPEIYP